MIAGLWLALSSEAALGADQPLYQPVPDWVKSYALPKPDAARPEAPTQLLLETVQDNFTPDGLDSFWEHAERIQTPQGLGEVGNIALDWDPDTENLVIHRIAILRGDRVIDLLAGGRSVAVLRRESRLESAMLDGMLTAAIQPEGLEVGDVLDIAITLQERNPLLRGRDARVAHLPTAPTRRFVLRELWPAGPAPRWRATAGMPGPRVTAGRDGGELLIDLADALRPQPPDDAPGRYGDPGRIEIGQLADWREVSALMAPLYRDAAQLAPDSPLRAEVARIAAVSADPRIRAAAALHLVQDQVRYLFLGMKQGGYRPAPADLSWQRRFADCKGKTVLLLALLQALGIAAEPAVVNTDQGDGLDQRVPMVGAFDHVLVRATIDGRIYWLDGTRTGDRDLDSLPVPDDRWALPLRAPGAALEPVMPAPPDRPEALTRLRLDASAGLAMPAPARAELILRGDRAIRDRVRYADMAPAALDRFLREYWRKQYDWIDIAQVDAAYDPASGEERLTMTGSARMEWKPGRGGGGKRYETDGGDLGWRADFARDPGPDRDAPFAVPYPFFEATEETILLPNGGDGFAIDGDEVDQRAAGREFKRSVRIERGVFTMRASTRSIASEFPAAEAPTAKKALRDLADYTVYLRAPADYRVTDQELAALLAETPTTTDGFIHRGNVLYDRAQYDKAIQDYDQAVRLAPDDAVAYADRGNAYLGKPDTDRAGADFAKALALDPRFAFALRGMGIVQQRRHEDQAAVDSFTRALALDGDNIIALEHRAEANESIGHLDQALADYTHLARLQPKRADRHLGCLRLALALGDGARALAEADQALAIAPDALAHALRGVALARLDRRDEALAAYDRSIALKPTVLAYLERAAIRDTAARAESLADLALAQRLEPESIAPVIARAEIEARDGDDAAALADVAQALRRSPDDAGTLRLRARILLKEQRFAQALPDLDRLLASQPRDAYLLNGRCWSRAALGTDLDGALADCNAALGLRPDLAAALDSRGFVYLRLGRLDDAIRDYDAALKLAPRQATSLYGRGLARLRQHADAAGQADLAAARAIDPKIDGTFAGYGMRP